MAKSPFKLKSGNSPLFKQMGSSPLYQTRKPYEFQLGPGDTRPVENLASETSEKSTPETSEKPKKLLQQGTPKKTKRRSYAEAYKKRDVKLYGDLNLEEYTAEAKRQSASKKAGKGWDVPKKQMVSKTKVKTEVTPEVTPEVTTKVDTKVKEVKPKFISRKEIKQEKTARKSSGKLSRREIKYEKLASKAEGALAEGKGRKAKRLAKRASKKLRKKGVRTSDKGVGKTSDRMVDLGLG